MKNNNLIIEISRIQELMGKPLLLEQWQNIIKDIITWTAKNFTSSDVTIDVLIKRLKKAATEEEGLKILADLVTKSDEIANEVIPKIMSTITDVESKAIVDLKQELKKQLNAGVSGDKLKQISNNWVDKNVTTKFEGVKNIIKKDLENFITPNKTPLPKPKPKPKPENITDVAAQGIDEITPLTSQELKALEKLYRQKGLGKSFFRAMRQFVKSVQDMMKNQVELMDETLSLIKTFGEPTTTPAIKTDILRRIGDNLQTLTQRELVNKNIIDEWIETNVLDYKLKSKIKDIVGYKKAGHLCDNTALKEWQTNYVKLSKRRKNLRTQLNSLLNPLSWSGKNISKHGGVLDKWGKIIKSPEFSELRQWLKSGQTQKWSGIKDFGDKFGWPKAIGNMSKEFIVSYIMLSFVLAIIDYLSDLLGHYLQNITYIKDFDWVKTNAASFDEKLGEYKGEEKGVTLGSKVIKDITFKYLFDELTNWHNSFPGLIDDFLVFVGILNTTEISKENVEEVVKNLKKERDEYQRQRDSLENEMRRTQDETTPETTTPEINPETPEED
jgi:hypothetical protein